MDFEAKDMLMWVGVLVGAVTLYQFIKPQVNKEVEVI